MDHLLSTFSRTNIQESAPNQAAWHGRKSTATEFKFHPFPSDSIDAYASRATLLGDPRLHEASIAAARTVRRGAAFSSYRSTASEDAVNGPPVTQFKLFDHPVFGGALHDPSINAFEILSVVNLFRNEHSLGETTATERKFIKRIESMPLFLTHMTNHGSLTRMRDLNATMTLKSRDRLVEANELDLAAQENTMDIDESELAGEAYIYSAVEFGAQLQKGSSQFGDRALRFLLSDKLAEYAVALPDDQCAPFKTTSRRMLQTCGMTRNEIKALMHINNLGRPFTEGIYAGSSIKRGLAINTLLRLRATSNGLPVRDSLLVDLSPNRINNLVNGTGRPQVLLPREVNLAAGQYTLHDLNKLQ